MKLSNFKINKIVGDVKFASIDVTTGFLFKKTERRQIFKPSLFWIFTDTGRFTPGTTVENLEKAYEAHQLYSE